MKTKLRTYSGQLVDFVNPDPRTITIEDVAWHLSMECRWGGAVKRHYSVAEHSIWVARWAKKLAPKAKLAELCATYGLVHDAHEYILKDVMTPLKSRLPEYAPIATKVQVAILVAFGLPMPLPEVDATVHLADAICLWIESGALTKGSRVGICPRPEHAELEQVMTFALEGRALSQAGVFGTFKSLLEDAVL